MHLSLLLGSKQYHTWISFQKLLRPIVKASFFAWKHKTTPGLALSCHLGGSLLHLPPEPQEWPQHLGAGSAEPQRWPLACWAYSAEAWLHLRQGRIHGTQDGLDWWKHLGPQAPQAAFWGIWSPGRWLSLVHRIINEKALGTSQGTCLPLGPRSSGTCCSALQS